MDLSLKRDDERKQYKIQNNNPVLTDMDVNKGRYEEIFPVVTTVYKSTSPMDFVAVLKFKVYNSSFYSPLRWRCCFVGIVILFLFAKE